MIYKKDAPIILPKDVFIGHPKAPVTLMEYGDYECETALHNDLIVREVLQRFPGMVNFNYRHFPQLRIHQRAHKAAEAAIAAAQIGMFPQMHDIILRNRRNLGAASLVTGKFGQYVQDDLAAGLKLGVKEAPSFFINGEKVEGRISVKNLCDQVEAACRSIRTIGRARAAKIRV